MYKKYGDCLEKKIRFLSFPFGKKEMFERSFFENKFRQTTKIRHIKKTLPWLKLESVNCGWLCNRSQTDIG
jgi:hypothetical protein